MRALVAEGGVGSCTFPHGGERCPALVHELALKRARTLHLNLKVLEDGRDMVSADCVEEGTVRILRRLYVVELPQLLLEGPSCGEGLLNLRREGHELLVQNRRSDGSHLFDTCVVLWCPQALGHLEDVSQRVVLELREVGIQVALEGELILVQALQPQKIHEAYESSARMVHHPAAAHLLEGFLVPHA